MGDVQSVFLFAEALPIGSWPRFGELKHKLRQSKISVNGRKPTILHATAGKHSIVRHKISHEMTISEQPPEFFASTDNYGIYQPRCHLAKDEAVELVDHAVLYCRENGIEGLVVDITQATGLPTPSISDVFWFITRWAETSMGEVTIAMVAPPEMITPDKIGITIAANRGLKSQIFTKESDAREWLRSELTPSKQLDS